MQHRDPPDVSASVIEPIALPAAGLRRHDLGEPATEPVLGIVTVAGREAEAGRDVEAAIAEAYDALAARLRAFAIRATRDPEVADDLVQEAFLRLVLELRAGRWPDNLGGWLYRVVANLIVSGRRRRSVADRLKSQLLRRDSPATPEETVLGNERDRTLARALARLPPDARVAVLLASRGMGSAEIGLVINRTPAATRTYLCRARLRLREAFLEIDGETVP
ncbi:MAG: sigma-70 family RNA polymerase sigma factor [Chloroflexi bacterium]|nr:sigma-70 family RNA polymerase sigma factor [Chloroflexota bacterium]